MAMLLGMGKLRDGSSYNLNDRPSLQGLYEPLLRHVSLGFSPQDIMGSLGRKINGNFKGEVVTLLGKRPQGWRVKHDIKGNRMKMYDKPGPSPPPKPRRTAWARLLGRVLDVDALACARCGAPMVTSAEKRA
jgi:hypothetical protein